MPSTIARIFGAALALLLLCACVITSSTNLLADAELVTPLPDSFSMFPYKQGPGGYIRADDAPMAYAKTGSTYTTSPDGNDLTTIRLAPLGDGTYLLAASGKDPGTLYGTLTYRDGVATIHIILPDKLKSVLDPLTATAPPTIAADIAVQDGAITVTKRETLDWLIARLADGTLPTQPLIAWLGPADATPPHMIVEKDGKFVGQ